VHRQVQAAPGGVDAPLADADAPGGDGDAVLWPPQAPAARAKPMMAATTAMILVVFMLRSLSWGRDRARPRNESVMPPRRP